ncbi:MAG: MotA/TolQ/ExbB proton channel family protein [Myxococcales bacterium]|nr:MotA/TolQ/ExbB proton channel family protein [Myxococcales bacterium]
MNGLPELQKYWEVAAGTLTFMLAVSVLTVALALERWVALMRARAAVQRVQDVVLGAARRGDLDEARRLADGLPSPVREVFTAGLDRALGRVRGEFATAMARETKRAVARLRGTLWVLGSVGALMPFAGLLGTVLGVMGSFEAIGDQQAGGFAVVSAGISEALVATAAGLFVALEAVILFNMLGQQVAGVGRELAFAVDELGELIRSSRGHAERSAVDS